MLTGQAFNPMTAHYQEKETFKDTDTGRRAMRMKAAAEEHEGWGAPTIAADGAILEGRREARMKGSL